MEAPTAVSPRLPALPQVTANLSKVDCITTSGSANTIQHKNGKFGQRPDPEMTEGACQKNRHFLGIFPKSPDPPPYPPFWEILFTKFF